MILNRLKEIIPTTLKRRLKRGLQNVSDSVRYRCSRKIFDSGNRRHVVLVCKGNICRSAFAEYYLRREMPAGMYRVESCGLDVDQGLYSPPEAVSIAREFELDLELHRSKGLSSCDVQSADLVLPMEFRQYLRLKNLFPDHQRKIRLLRDFAPWPDRLLCNIQDPYGAHEKEFRRCFNQLKRALDGLKRHIAAQRDSGE